MAHARACRATHRAACGTTLPTIPVLSAPYPSFPQGRSSGTARLKPRTFCMANYQLSPKAASMLDQLANLLDKFRCEAMPTRVSAPPDDGAAMHVARTPQDSRRLEIAAATTTPAPRTASVAVDNSSDSETSVAATSSAAIWQPATTAAVSDQQPPRAEKRAHDVDEAGLGAVSSKRARSSQDFSPDKLGGVKRTRISWSPEQEVALIMGASIYGATRSWAKILLDPWLQPALTRDGSARSNKDLKDKFRNLILKHGVDKLVRDGKLAWDVLYARVPSAVHGASLPLPSEIAAFSARNASGSKNSARATAPMEAPGAQGSGREVAHACVHS